MQHELGTHFESFAQGAYGIEGVWALQQSRLDGTRITLGTVAALGARELFQPGNDLLSRVPPESTKLILGHPQTDAWATRCRELTRTGKGREMLAEEIRYYSALAASAAIRGGVPFDGIGIPIENGKAMLPTLGGGVFEGSDSGSAIVQHQSNGLVTITSGAETIRLPADGGVTGTTSWYPLRHITVPSPVASVDFEIDDVSPKRRLGLYGAPVADRLPEDEVLSWQDALEGAWRLLRNSLPEQADAIMVGIRSLIPLRSPAHIDRRSSRTPAFGAIALTTPTSSMELAMPLVEEFWEGAFRALHSRIPLHEAPSAERRYHGPWQDLPVSFEDFFCGTYAHLGVIDLWIARRASTQDPEDHILATVEIERWRNRLSGLADKVDGSGFLTKEGRLFTEAMRWRFRRLEQLTTPPKIANLARISETDNRLSWRLRNLVPDAEAIGELAARWLAGLPCPEQESEIMVMLEVSPQHTPVWSNYARKRLMLQALLGAEPGDAYASDGDKAYAANADLSGVYHYYQAAIRANPDSAEPWSGLALIYERAADEAKRALFGFPEVVYALHKAIHHTSGVAPYPAPLARWLSRLPEPRILEY